MEHNPTHEQARLHLQIYEERREPRLRQARDWFFANCFADSMDEAMRIAPMGTEAGTNFMMVISTAKASVPVRRSVRHMNRPSKPVETKSSQRSWGLKR